MNERDFLKQAKLLQNEILAHRRYLHQHAETGFCLTQTTAYIKMQLVAMGYEPQDCGKSGVIATIGTQKNAPVFLLRADMDALSMAEEASVDFAANNGNMHACGHDMHAAMLLGAAKLLKLYEDSLCGCVKLMFQPAEEGLEGARDMLENGVLKKPDVRAGLMLHVLTSLPLKSGSVVVSAGGVSAPAADYFKIEVQGKGCHGSTPQAGVDALTVAAYILIGLQEISARELGLGEKAVLTIGSLQSGESGNVISDKATLSGTMRCFDESVRARVKSRLEEIATQIAKAFRATATVTFQNGCPPLINDETLSAFALSVLPNLLGKENVLNAAELGNGVGGGSEDFAYVSKEIPTLMLALPAGEDSKGYDYPLHHPKATFDESVLYLGSAIYAFMAMEWLKNKT